MSERDDDRARIRAVLKTINDGWLQGTAGDLPRLLRGSFHDKVVFRGPDLAITAEGSAAAISSYQEFMRSATIRDWALGEPEIDLAGDTAIATYGWRLEYRLGGRDYDEFGHEVVVLTRDEVQWLVRWRTVIAGT